VSVHYSGASAAEFHRLPSPQPITVAAGLWPPEGTRKIARWHGFASTVVRDPAAFDKGEAMRQVADAMGLRRAAARRPPARMLRRRPRSGTQSSRGGSGEFFTRPAACLAGPVHLPLPLAAGDDGHRLVQRALAAGQSAQG